jgi:mRNA-degrading endonuclease RelE of RelBE toxin-antitoxin system
MPCYIKIRKENFKKEILSEASTRKDLSDLEKFFIEKTNAVRDPMSYNIASGGFGGNTIAGYTKEERKEFGNKIKEIWDSYTEEEREEIRNKRKQKWKDLSQEEREEFFKSIKERDKNKSPRKIYQKSNRSQKGKGKGRISPKRLITTEQEKELKDMYLNGISVTELCQRYNVQRYNLDTYLRRLLPNTPIYEIHGIKTKRGKNIKNRL